MVHVCVPGGDTAASTLRRVIEVFGTERASEDFIFNNQSLPFLQQVTKPGGSYKFIQAVIYTPQEANPVPFVSPTGFLNADLSPFVAHITTQVHPPCLTPLCCHWLPLCPQQPHALESEAAVASRAACLPVIARGQLSHHSWGSSACEHCKSDWVADCVVFSFPLHGYQGAQVTGRLTLPMLEIRMTMPMTLCCARCAERHHVRAQCGGALRLQPGDRSWRHPVCVPVLL